MGIFISRISFGSRTPVFEPGAGADRPFYVAGAGIYNENDNATLATNLPPIPVEWIIAPLNATAAQCPSHAATLRTFGITNAIMVVLAIVFGCRPIVHFLTKGLMGTRGGKTVRWIWILNLALQLLGNLFVSIMIHNSAGYGHLSILNIFALYSARPRVSLLALTMLRIFGAVNLKILRKAGNETNETEFVYSDSFRTAAFSELCMQIFAAIFVGVTWGRFPNKEVKDWMSGTYKGMYAVPAVTLVGIAAYGAFKRNDGEAVPRGQYGYLSTKYPAYRNVWLWRFGLAVLACLFIGFGYFWQWIYFLSFLELPGSLYVDMRPWFSSNDIY
jgi:hypothetical protein